MPVSPDGETYRYRARELTTAAGRVRAVDGAPDFNWHVEVLRRTRAELQLTTELESRFAFGRPMESDREERCGPNTILNRQLSWQAPQRLVAKS